jgi:hypothetical protein
MGHNAPFPDSSMGLLFYREQKSFDLHPSTWSRARKTIKIIAGKFSWNIEGNCRFFRDVLNL